MDSQLRDSNMVAVGKTINAYVGSSPTPIDTYVTYWQPGGNPQELRWCEQRTFASSFFSDEHPDHHADQIFRKMY